ncbi:MAG: UDP-N-acetylmuramate--L-alanine ligase [Acidobacteriia bacterium]|nr:UDP-N-acetylmuramate--L-alanine ligase [Terriglobia bacterium]
MFKHFKKIHFVGIGGIGMSGIAELLLNLGYEVSGSDLKASLITERLEKLGATVYIGHRKENIDDAHVVVFTSAVQPDNPELVEARGRNRPVIPRAEMLAELMRLKYGIAVAGAHGKTTTTSMVAAVLNEAGLDPTLIVGGCVNVLGTNARQGQGEWMVVEADESDRSFLKINPTIAVITNIDREHLDHYRDLEEIQAAFVSFANKVPFYGWVIACQDDPGVAAILPQLERRILTYGLSNAAQVRVTDVQLGKFETRFNILFQGESRTEFHLHTAGEHNALNAAAAIAVGLALDVPMEAIQKGLQEFRGTERRLEWKGERAGVTVIDDYGHHPTEIRATLAALKPCGYGRIIVVFQPHRFTRTQLLFDDFVSAFDGADAVVLTEIYAASEKPIAGVTASALVEKMTTQSRAEVHFASSFEAAIEFLIPRLRPGDVVLTLGAGNIGTLGVSLLEKLGLHEEAITSRLPQQELNRMMRMN